MQYTSKVHELAIAQSILDLVVPKAQAHGASQIVSIQLRIGALTGIVPEALQWGFALLAQNSIAEKARLCIDPVPWKLRCLRCEHAFQVQNDDVHCPNCGALGGQTLEGNELQVLELDVQ